MRRPVRTVVLPAASTAVAVLDLGIRCRNPDEPCSRLIPGLGAFLDDARASGARIVFTNSRRLRGTPEGQLAPGLGRRPSEPVLFPDHFDKFHGGELHRFLERHRCTSLVICGSSTNVCVLYTATTAIRQHGLDVVIPVDGVNAQSAYRHRYALHQLANLPTASQVRFTSLGQIFWRLAEATA